MESIYHFKSLQPAHFFTFSNHWAVTPRPCLWKHKIDALTLSTLGSSLVARFRHQICMLRFLSSLWVSQVSVFVYLPVRKTSWIAAARQHLAGVCAICAFSQQVITNRRLTSHSVQLDSLCWHGQGWLWEGAGWQQLDSTHYGVKGKTETAMGRKYVLPFPASLALSTCVIFSFIVPYIQQSKNGFVTLQIYQMRSVSTFQRCTIWLPCGLHNTLMLCMTWLLDLWHPPVKDGGVVLWTMGIGVTLGPAESDVWSQASASERRNHIVWI